MPFGLVIEGQPTSLVVPLAGRRSAVLRRAAEGRDVLEIRVKLQAKCRVHRGHAVVTDDQLLGHTGANTTANFNLECVLGQSGPARIRTWARDSQVCGPVVTLDNSARIGTRLLAIEEQPVLRQNPRVVVE